MRVLCGKVEKEGNDKGSNEPERLGPFWGTRNTVRVGIPSAGGAEIITLVIDTDAFVADFTDGDGPRPRSLGGLHATGLEVKCCGLFTKSS